MVIHHTITTNVAELSWQDDFILIKFIQSDAAFDLEEAKRQYEAAKSLVNGEKYRVLIDVRDVSVSPEKEAQEFLSKVEEKIAEAILVNNLATRIISQYYITKNERSPVKIFTKKHKAIKWLKAQG
tara:strand:+ start:116199 stop:116576 length:378 start_codon:yes stop_codon:yes gene_type:complete